MKKKKKTETRRAEQIIINYDYLNFVLCKP